MDQLDNLIPLNEQCQNPKCQSGDYCRKFHGEDDCITIKANISKVMCKHSFNKKYSKICKMKASVCINKINNKDYCEKGESCLQLHDEEDEIILIFHFNKEPIIIHKYCYSVMPILPAEIWYKIIGHFSDSIYNYEGWSTIMFGLYNKSKNLSIAIKNVLIDYSNAIDSKVIDLARKSNAENCLNEI